MKAIEVVEHEGHMEDASPSSIKHQVDKIQNRKATKEPKKTWKTYWDDMEVIPPGSRKRRNKRNALSLQNKIHIACRILIKKELYHEVAKEFRTSQGIIHRLIKKVENKPEVLQELVEKERNIVIRRDEVANMVEEWDAADGFIDSAHSVQKKLLEEAKVHSTIEEIKNVMKKKLGMGFKKLSHITMTGNSPRNLILRQ